MTNEPTKMINFRATESTRKLIRKRAADEGLTVSEMIRRAVEAYERERPSMKRNARGVTIFVPLHLDRQKPTAKRKAS